VATFPFIRDLNPKLDDLRAILRIVRRREGDNDAIAEAIKKLFDKDSRRSGYTLHSINSNTMTSLREANLGVMTGDGHLTEFGKTLHGLVGDEKRFKAAVARHLIVEKGGLAFCRGLEAVARSGASHRKEIAEFLATKYSVDFWRDHNNISSMHNFLEWAGVCENYRLDHDRFKEVVGVDPATAKKAEEISPEASMLLQALVRAGGEAAAGDLRRQVEQLSGRAINPHSIPAYGKELESRGFIELPRQRGSKTAPWRVVSKKQAEIIAEVAASLSGARPLSDDVFSRTFADLLKATETDDTDKKGRALENLAARICWKLGLQNIEIRKLSDYEIDVRAEGRHPVFQKWVLQCKATRTALGPAPVLREYGIAKLENIPIIVFVVTAGVSGRALAVADQIMRQSNKVVIILDEKELGAIAKDEKVIWASLERQSEHAREVKMPQKEAEVVSELVGETEDASGGAEGERPGGKGSPGDPSPDAAPSIKAVIIRRAGRRRPRGGLTPERPSED